MLAFKLLATNLKILQMQASNKPSGRCNLSIKSMRFAQLPYLPEACASAKQAFAGETLDVLHSERAEDFNTKGKRLYKR